MHKSEENNDRWKYILIHDDDEEFCIRIHSASSPDSCGFPTGRMSNVDYGIFTGNLVQQCKSLLGFHKDNF